ncbi:hypothetical protein Sgou_04720 [Streptomyces gougerotii]|uniref:Uncharacterized protein n=1 Tax=Streptomyces gougerotii TaxID=53448 RepID=A0A8H9HD60_9ACTN|nr:hypothetical protein Sgou_04720 [Streptomyces gougerotii]GGU58576.1 hypothetical protein GCM10010227_09690 [Streptomyces gougerotii]
MVSGSGQSGVADQGGHGDTGESRLADVEQSARGTVAVAALLLGRAVDSPRKADAPGPPEGGRWDRSARCPFLIV